MIAKSIDGSVTIQVAQTFLSAKARHRREYLCYLAPVDTPTALRLN